MVATYKLLDSSDPKLKIKLDPIEEGVDRLILKNNLIETMNKHNAFGLAAIQCGVMQRVFAMCSGENKKVKTICFNPENLPDSQPWRRALAFPGGRQGAEPPPATGARHRAPPNIFGCLAARERTASLIVSLFRGAKASGRSTSRTV